MTFEALFHLVVQPMDENDLNITKIICDVLLIYSTINWTPSLDFNSCKKCYMFILLNTESLHDVNQVQNDSKIGRWDF